MDKILLFAGSNSSKSINKKLIHYTASHLSYSFEILDLNLYEVPIYSIDREEKDGIPELIQRFLKVFESATGVIISLAEHNGSYTVAFKNVLDWSSRANKDFMKDKKMFLMATSPGKRGGKGVLDVALNSFPRYGADILASFSLPAFYENFNEDKGLTDSSLQAELKSLIRDFEKSL